MEARRGRELARQKVEAYIRAEKVIKNFSPNCIPTESLMIDIGTQFITGILEAKTLWRLEKMEGWYSFKKKVDAAREADAMVAALDSLDDLEGSYERICQLASTAGFAPKDFGLYKDLEILTDERRRKQMVANLRQLIRMLCQVVEQAKQVQGFGTPGFNLMPSEKEELLELHRALWREIDRITPLEEANPGDPEEINLLRSHSQDISGIFGPTVPSVKCS